MPNYKQQSGGATTWQRSKEILITNQYGRIPTATFYEEQVTTLDDGTMFNRGLGAIVKEISNPAESFPLYHPETNQIIGEGNFAQVAVMLHSVYMHLANLRDNPPAPPAPPVAPPVEAPVEPPTESPVEPPAEQPAP